MEFFLLNGRLREASVSIENGKSARKIDKRERYVHVSSELFDIIKC